MTWMQLEDGAGGEPQIFAQDVRPSRVRRSVAGSVEDGDETCETYTN